MVRVTPVLLFDGNCAEAMTFYHECLGGELTITKLGDTPMKAQFPSEKYERVINAYLNSGGIEISATDWMADDFDPLQGNTTALFVTGQSADELRPLLDRLKDGEHNSRLKELHEVSFGVYGQFYDRYGVQWIFRGEA